MKKTIGIILIVAGIIFAVLFIIEGVKVQLEDTSSIYGYMDSYGKDISSIKSVGGRTLEEAYYQAYGSYLSRDANVREVEYKILKSSAMMHLYTGLCLCIVFILSGIYLCKSEGGQSPTSGIA